MYWWWGSKPNRSCCDQEFSLCHHISAATYFVWMSTCHFVVSPLHCNVKWWNRCRNVALNLPWEVLGTVRCSVFGVTIKAVTSFLSSWAVHGQIAVIVGAAVQNVWDKSTRARQSLWGSWTTFPWQEELLLCVVDPSLLLEMSSHWAGKKKVNKKWGLWRCGCRNVGKCLFQSSCFSYTTFFMLFLICR